MIEIHIGVISAKVQLRKRHGRTGKDVPPSFAITQTTRPSKVGEPRKSPRSFRNEGLAAADMPAAFSAGCDQKATVAETTTREPAMFEPSLVEEKFGVR